MGGCGYRLVELRGVRGHCVTLSYDRQTDFKSPWTVNIILLHVCSSERVLIIYLQRSSAAGPGGLFLVPGPDQTLASDDYNKVVTMFFCSGRKCSRSVSADFFKLKAVRLEPVWSEHTNADLPPLLQ